jgi:hypothetical protein
MAETPESLPQQKLRELLEEWPPMRTPDELRLAGAWARARMLILELRNARRTIAGQHHIKTFPDSLREPMELRLAQADKIDEIFCALNGTKSIAAVGRAVFLSLVRLIANGVLSSNQASAPFLHGLFGAQFPEYAARIVNADVEDLLKSYRKPGRPKRGLGVRATGELTEFQCRLSALFRKMGIAVTEEGLREVLRGPRHAVGIPKTESMMRRQHRRSTGK